MGWYRFTTGGGDDAAAILVVGLAFELERGHERRMGCVGMHRAQMACLGALALSVLVQLNFHWTWVCGILTGRLSHLLNRRISTLQSTRTLYGVSTLVILLRLMGVRAAIGRIMMHCPASRRFLQRAAGTGAGARSQLHSGLCMDRSVMETRGARNKPANSARGSANVSTRRDAPTDPTSRAAGRRFRAAARLVGARARIKRRRSVLILTGLSLGISWLMFPPVNWGWLGYVCLVPWLVCVCTFSAGRFVYLVSWLLGLGYFAMNIRWMIPVTFAGYAALCIGYSLFFPLAAWPIRHMHKRHGVSVALTTAVVWTAVEYLRSIGDLAFPWMLLAHSQYKYLTMIQISDLVGVYGVSFVLGMVNGWLTDLLIQPILVWRADQISRLPLGTMSLAIVLAGTVFYGLVRRSDRGFERGPRVAVIQHDFPMYVDERAWRTGTDLVFHSYLALGEKAAAEKPDLIVFPETAMTGYINEEFITATPGQLDEIRQRRFPNYTREDLIQLQATSRELRQSFQRLSTTSGIPIVLGSSAMEWKPTAIPPRAEAFNSSFLLAPGKTKPVARYDKNHLVLFGEYVPFRYSYHWLYRWFNSFTPWGAAGVEYSLGAGSGFAAFEFSAASRGRTYRAGTPICYEEIMPYIGREFALGRSDGAAKGVDMLLSISNDGWFLHTPELEQHLAGGIFRAVENRIGMARSVNTGASSFVEPNGRIVDRVTLAPDKISDLPPVEAALVKLRSKVNSLATAAGAPSRRDIDPLLTGLAAAVQRMGKEFTYLHERLVRMSWRVTTQAGPQRQEATKAILDQIDEDIDTVGRWRERPDTAPGYRISEVKCDLRTTLYSRWGDWFAQGASALSGMMLLDWLLRRVWRRAKSIGQEVSHAEGI